MILDRSTLPVIVGVRIGRYIHLLCHIGDDYVRNLLGMRGETGFLLEELQ
jgi:hypothetical protein